MHFWIRTKFRRSQPHVLSGPFPCLGRGRPHNPKRPSSRHGHRLPTNPNQPSNQHARTKRRHRRQRVPLLNVSNEKRKIRLDEIRRHRLGPTGPGARHLLPHVLPKHQSQHKTGISRLLRCLHQRCIYI